MLLPSSAVLIIPCPAQAAAEYSASLFVILLDHPLAPSAAAENRDEHGYIIICRNCRHGSREGAASLVGPASEPGLQPLMLCMKHDVQMGRALVSADFNA